VGGGESGARVFVGWDRGGTVGVWRGVVRGSFQASGARWRSLSIPLRPLQARLRCDETTQSMPRRHKAAPQRGALLVQIKGS
jgi:hypothetical protein